MGQNLTQPKELNLQDLHLSAERGNYHTELFQNTKFGSLEIKCLYRLFDYFSSRYLPNNSDYNNNNYNNKIEKTDGEIYVNVKTEKDMFEKKMNKYQLLSLYFYQIFNSNVYQSLIGKKKFSVSPSLSELPFYHIQIQQQKGNNKNKEDGEYEEEDEEENEEEGEEEGEELKENNSILYLISENENGKKKKRIGNDKEILYILEKIFGAIDKDNDGLIDFKTFAIAMSQGIKGTLEEKMKFSFDIISYDIKSKKRLNIIKKSEILKFLNSFSKIIFSKRLKAVKQIFHKNELEFKNMIDFYKKLINTFFEKSEQISKNNENNEKNNEENNINNEEKNNKKNRNGKHTEKSLSFEDYKKTCLKYPELNKILSIYSLVFKPLFQPIKFMLRDGNPRYECDGFLQTNESSLFFFEKFQKPTYFELKGGVIIQYKTSEKKSPIKIYPLLGSIFQEEKCDKKNNIFIFKLIMSDRTIHKFKSKTLFDLRKWTNTILMYNLEECKNRYNSFAPIRRNINAIWYVNAKMVYERMADVLENAKEEIFITSWWISPEVYLRKRINSPSLHDRFDYILQKKAKEGVMIYMILWNETKIVQGGLNSGYARGVFENLHENFKVLCHPPIFPVEWCHHQKLLIVDQNIAFHGGVDVCWGRWDDVEHRIADPCHFKNVWPGKDFFNPTVKGTSDVENPHHDHIDREFWPRLSWHDIHMEVDGIAARDVSKNFIERWNNSRNDIIVTEINLATRFQLQRKFPVLTLKTSKIKNCIWNPYHPKNELFSTNIPEYERPVRNHPLLEKKVHAQFNQDKFEKTITKVIQEETKFSPSIEVTSPVFEGNNNFDNNKNRFPKINNYNINNNKNIIDYNNDENDKSSLLSYSNSTTSPSSPTPSSQSSPTTSPKTTPITPSNKKLKIKIKKKNKKNKISKSKSSPIPITSVRPKKLKFQTINDNTKRCDSSHTCTVQMVRCLAGWAGGSHVHTEDSLYPGYIDIINRAKHYIFIENQYFVSNTAGYGVQNMIAEAILNKIRYAIINRKKFRVFIFIPVHPDGRYQRSNSVRYVLYWSFQTLSRGGTSMIETLKKEFPKVDISNYLQIFYGRSFDFIGDKPVTEQIYMHGKMIIVDDKWVAIGSANVNDRSMLGYRDSEFATIIEDQKIIDSKMNGKPFKARRFAITLRLFLFREWLGLKYNDMSILDPISDSTYHGIVMKIAENNTKIFEEVFPNAPSNKISSWEKVVDKSEESIVKDEKKLCLLKKVKGFIVKFPLNFLIDGSLTPKPHYFETFLLSDKIYQ